MDARSYEMLHLSRKIILANLQIWCSKMQPLRKSAPWPPNISDEHVFCTVPATRNASLKILFKCPTPAIVFGHATRPSRFCSLLTRCTIPCACHAKAHLNVQKCSVPVSFLHFWLRNVLRATTACTFSIPQLPKVVRSCGVLYIFTWKCASRHNGVHFFDISTSKSGPNLLCFAHFDLEMCFAPQRRAIFHLWIWPGGSATAALASLLFDPPEPQIIGKSQCFAAFLPFRASASSFFWLFLFSDLRSSTLLFSLTLPISAFHLSILSEVWLLNFLRPA